MAFNFCFFLVFLLYCTEIFILIIPILLKFRNKLLFNQFVEPRENAKYTGGDIPISFCHVGIFEPGEDFQPNNKFVVAGHALGHKGTKLVKASNLCVTKRKFGNLSDHAGWVIKCSRETIQKG